MSTSQIENPRIPVLTLGWRPKMALGDTKAQDMADYLGVSRQTLTRWMGDIGRPPARAYILAWAMRTNIDPVWLETGETPTGPEPGGGLVAERARRDSNPKPSDPKVVVSEIAPPARMGEAA